MIVQKLAEGSGYCIVLCTCPDQTVAESIANELVKNKLAACVNIVPGITSIYQWKGNLEKSQEQLLVIKTKSAVFKALETAILSQHPYELPEIISIPLINGLPNYLSWIDDNIDVG
jgi:periplasmic divalent cation tolerance protein